MDSDKVSYQRRGPTAIMTITRPARRNAIDVDTAEALLAGYRLFEADDTARVLVLTGQGDDAFCAGADLHDGAGLSARLHEPGGTIGFTRFTSLKPTIAAINGWCLGAGMDLAEWCDLRIATAASTFGFVERRWDVPSIDGYSQRLPRLIGLARALDLMLTGRHIVAEQALAFGLISEIALPSQHMTRALQIAEQIASYPQPGLLMTRCVALEALDLPLADGLALEVALPPTPSPMQTEPLPNYVVPPRSRVVICLAT